VVDVPAQATQKECGRQLEKLQNIPMEVPREKVEMILENSRK